MRVSFGFLVLLFCGFVLGGSGNETFSLSNFSYDEVTVGGNFELSFLSSVNCSCDYFVNDLHNGSFNSDNGSSHFLSRSFPDEGERELKIVCDNGSEVVEEVVDFIYVKGLSWSLIEPKDNYVEHDFFDLEFDTTKDAICRWTLDEDYEDDFTYMDAFDETDGRRHKLDVEKAEAGRYTYYVGCEDEFGVVFYQNYDVKVDLKRPEVKVEAQSVDAGFYDEVEVEYFVEDDLDTRVCYLYSNIFGEFEKNGYSTKVEDGEVNSFVLKNVNFSGSNYVFEIRCADFVDRESGSGNRSLRVVSLGEDDVKQDGSDIRENGSVISLNDEVDDVSGGSVITGNVVGSFFNGTSSEFFGYFVLTVLGLVGFGLMNGNFLEKLFWKKKFSKIGKRKDFRRSDLIDLFAMTLIRERKRRRLSRKRVAGLVGVDVGELKSLEDGVLPSENFDLIMRLEDFYGVNLRRYK
jgi:hypothetical protein